MKLNTFKQRLAAAQSLQRMSDGNLSIHVNVVKETIDIWGFIYGDDDKPAVTVHGWLRHWVSAESNEQEFNRIKTELENLTAKQ